MQQTLFVASSKYYCSTKPVGSIFICTHFSWNDCGSFACTHNTFYPRHSGNNRQLTFLYILHTCSHYNIKPLHERNISQIQCNTRYICSLTGRNYGINPGAWKPSLSCEHWQRFLQVDIFCLHWLTCHSCNSTSIH